MIFIAAMLQKMCNCCLGERWTTDVVDPFCKLHFFGKLSRDGPTDTVAGSKRFGKGRAMHYQPFCIVVLAGARPVLAEIQFAVNIIFDQRDIMLGDQLYQFLFMLIGHTATYWVVVIGNTYERLDVEFTDGFF